MNSLEQILTDTPDVKSFGRWIKASKTPPKEIEKQLLAQPNQVYKTIGMDWLLAHAKPENLLPFLELLFARRPRPQFLFPWNEALQSGLKKDKRGKPQVFGGLGMKLAKTFNAWQQLWADAM